jgi:hypothetical protein
MATRGLPVLVAGSTGRVNRTLTLLEGRIICLAETQYTSVPGIGASLKTARDLHSLNDILVFLGTGRDMCVCVC